MEEMMWVLGITTIAISVNVALVRRRARQSDLRARNIARVLGLQHHPHLDDHQRWLPGLTVPGHVAGTLEARRVSIKPLTLVEDTLITAVNTHLTHRLTDDLSITPRSLTDHVVEWFGDQSLDTGDKAFDERFVVKGRDGATIARLLTPRVRQTLIRAADQLSNLKITDRAITTHLPKWFPDIARIRATLHTHRRIATALDAALLDVQSKTQEP